MWLTFWSKPARVEQAKSNKVMSVNYYISKAAGNNRKRETVPVGQRNSFQPLGEKSGKECEPVTVVLPKIHNKEAWKQFFIAEYLQYKASFLMWDQCFVKGNG